MVEHCPAEGAPGGTGNWSSRLHPRPGSDGCRLFELEITVHIATAPAGDYTFEATLPGDTAGTTRREDVTIQIAQHTQADVDAFYQAFEDAVYVGWNDKLWLVHSGSVTGCYHGYEQTYENLKCAIKLTRTRSESDAQLRVLMLYRPQRVNAAGEQISTAFRSNCERGGRSWSWFGFANPVDMKVADSDTADRTLTWPTTGGNQSFTQCVVQHEFGHYIGLPHTCASSGGLNSDAQYCIGGSPQRMSNMMAVGNVVTTRHARPWLNRLPRHAYFPDRGFTWSPRTTAPTSTVEACPGPQRGPSMAPRASGRR